MGTVCGEDVGGVAYMYVNSDNKRRPVFGHQHAQVSSRRAFKLQLQATRAAENK